MYSLTHNEAFRILDRTGTLIAKLHGRPDLVIGIARSGTALGETVARASGAAAFVVIGGSRVTSEGTAGNARNATQRVVPGSVRRAYKTTLYPMAVRAAARRVETRALSAEDLHALKCVLNNRSGGPVVIIDDSIDTGKTVNLLLRTVEDLDPGANVIIVALNSTIGIVCGPHQLSFVHGAHLHNSDGDPSGLHSDGAPIRSHDPDPEPWVRPRIERQLYLDLDHTLCRGNTFTMAAQILLKMATRGSGTSEGRQLLAAAGLRKTRTVSHLHLKQVVDNQIRSLSDTDDVVFQNELAKRMRIDARPALLSIARSPAVRSSIVTAALSSYQPAIEQAFGLPVLCGAHRSEDGCWIEPGGVEKSTAIAADDRPDVPSLLVGDAMADLLAAGPVASTLIPEWDTSGLTTILAATAWWDD